MLNQLPIPLREAKIKGLSAATGAVAAFGVLMEAGAADSAFAKGSAANVAAFLLVVSAFHYVASWQFQEATSFGKQNIDLVRIRVAGWRAAQRVTRILLPVLLVLLGWHVCKAVSTTAWAWFVTAFALFYIPLGLLDLAASHYLNFKEMLGSFRRTFNKSL